MGANVSSAETHTRGGEDMKLTKPRKHHLHRHRHVPSPCVRSKVTYLQTELQWDACFKANKRTNDLLVINFAARWCGPSKLAGPKLKDLAATYTDVEFVKIEVEVLSGVAVEFDIGEVPAFVFVKRGRELDRAVGADFDELNKMIQKYRLSYY